MELLKNVLLIFGLTTLIIALRPIQLVMVALPRGQIRSLWKVLFGLVCIFTTGYLGYLLTFWGTAEGLPDLIVPIIFFLGALFVLLVCLLSLQTSYDLKRIYVLEHETTIDSLTGIYNRRHFDRRLREEFSRAARHDEPLSLVMIDIDYFKYVNDQWGHPVGDLVLRRLAEVITGSVRDGDVVCRYGGEELAILLPHTAADSATRLAERVRSQTEKTEVLTENISPSKQAVRVTISLGVASGGPSIDSADKLVDRADRALYAAKESGRNQVVTTEETDSGDGLTFSRTS